MYGRFIDGVGLDVTVTVPGKPCHGNCPHEFSLSRDSLVTPVPDELPFPRPLSHEGISVARTVTHFQLPT